MKIPYIFRLLNLSVWMAITHETIFLVIHALIASDVEVILLLWLIAWYPTKWPDRAWKDNCTEGLGIDDSSLMCCPTSSNLVDYIELVYSRTSSSLSWTHFFNACRENARKFGIDVAYLDDEWVVKFNQTRKLQCHRATQKTRVWRNLCVWNLNCVGYVYIWVRERPFDFNDHSV